MGHQICLSSKSLFFSSSSSFRALLLLDLFFFWFNHKDSAHLNGCTGELYFWVGSIGWGYRKGGFWLPYMSYSSPPICFFFFFDFGFVTLSFPPLYFFFFVSFFVLYFFFLFAFSLCGLNSSTWKLFSSMQLFLSFSFFN